MILNHIANSVHHCPRSSYDRFLPLPWVQRTHAYVAMSIAHCCEITCLHVNPSPDITSSHIAVGDGSGIVKVYSLTNGLVGILSPPTPGGGGSTSIVEVAMSPCGTKVCVVTVLGAWILAVSDGTLLASAPTFPTSNERRRNWCGDCYCLWFDETLLVGCHPTRGVWSYNATSGTVDPNVLGISGGQCTLLLCPSSDTSSTLLYVGSSTGFISVHKRGPLDVFTLLCSFQVLPSKCSVQTIRCTVPYSPPSNATTTMSIFPHGVTASTFRSRGVSVVNGYTQSVDHLFLCPKDRSWKTTSFTPGSVTPMTAGSTTTAEHVWTKNLSHLVIACMTASSVHVSVWNKHFMFLHEYSWKDPQCKVFLPHPMFENVIVLGFCMSGIQMYNAADNFVVGEVVLGAAEPISCCSFLTDNFGRDVDGGVTLIIGGTVGGLHVASPYPFPNLAKRIWTCVGEFSRDCSPTAKLRLCSLSGDVEFDHDKEWQLWCEEVNYVTRIQTTQRNRRRRI